MSFNVDILQSKFASVPTRNQLLFHFKQQIRQNIITRITIPLHAHLYAHTYGNSNVNNGESLQKAQVQVPYSLYKYLDESGKLSFIAFKCA